MDYKLFGSTGLKVSELCLGVMTFGENWGWGSSKADSRKIFERFVDAGGNFFDTANLYTDGQSEEYLGELINSERENYVVATKYSSATSLPHPNASGNSRKHMMAEVDKSLKRLNTDYIDIYWVHQWDFVTPIEEVLRGMDDLISSGKVLYTGLSNTPAWIVSRTNTIAELRGWNRFAGLQLEYNLIKRKVEAEYFPMAKVLDLCLTCWSPLAGGQLTGKYLEGQIKTEPSKRISIANKKPSERNDAIVQSCIDIAKKHDATPAQVALRWILQKNNRTLPIIGARTLEQLEDNLACLELILSDEDMEVLDTVSDNSGQSKADKKIMEAYSGSLSNLDRSTR